MNWLFPSLFWALGALSIPIFIHLFSFRKFKLVYFTNVRFLDNLLKESKSYARLKRLLILLSRLLAFACLVLAFIQPFLPAKQAESALNQGKRVISVFVDNSFSMEGINKFGRLLEEATKKAKTIISSFDNADDFYLLTHDFEGKHMHALSKDEALAYLDEIKITSASKSYKQIYTKQQEQLNFNTSSNKLSFFISDFQKVGNDFSQIKSDSLINTTLIPLYANQQSNVFIDSIYTKNPVTQLNMPQQLIVRVVNEAENDIVDAVMRLSMNNKERAPVSFSVPSKSTALVEIPFIWQERLSINGVVSIDDQQITFDDKMYFSIAPSVNVKVLLIKGAASNIPMNLKTIYGNDSLFQYQETNEANIDFSLMKDASTVVLDHLGSLSSGLALELKKFLDKGGYVLIVPPKNADIAAYNTALQPLGVAGYADLDTGEVKVTTIDVKHPLFEGVFEKVRENLDLPTVKAYFIELSNLSAPKKSIVKTSNGASMLTEYTISKGKLYAMNTSLESNSGNFGKHALLVPICINIALNSLQGSSLYYLSGHSNKIVINANDGYSEVPYLMKSIDEKYSFIPEVRSNELGNFLYTNNEPQQAGNYSLSRNKVYTQNLAFNYSRAESHIESYTPSEMEAMIKKYNLLGFSLIEKSDAGLQDALFALHKGKSLWMYFLFASILFFIIEILLLKLFKS